MPSPIDKVRSDLPLPKRQKLEETITSDDDNDSNSSIDPTEEEIQLWYDEFDRSQGFEIDFSKLTYCSSFKQVDLDKISYFSDPGPNRDFIATLAEMALKDRNAKDNTNLKVGKILRANFHPSGAVTYYISFEVTDGNETKPYQAIVGYLNSTDHQVCSCFPKP